MLDAMTAEDVTPTGEVTPEPFDEFYRREYGPIVALGYALTGDRGAAEDLAQDAFFAAHRRWDRLTLYVHRARGCGAS